MKEFIKAEGITTRIRMMRTAGHTGAFLLVEGDDDAIFFRDFVDRTCRIQIGYGKDKVETAIAILDRENFLGLLGIVDADADILEGKTPFSPNLIWTDLRDIEMMFIRSRALDRLLDRFANPELMSPDDVRTQILTVGTPIGYWRWLSFRKNLALDFKILDLSDFIDEKTLKLDAHAATGTTSSSLQISLSGRSHMPSQCKAKSGFAFCPICQPSTTLANALRHKTRSNKAA